MIRLFFVLISFILSSCAVDPDGYLKRSANNKLIDTKGFNAKKRRPIYNKKYITQAKKNILNNDLIQSDEVQDDLSELEDTYKANTEMYQHMIEQEKTHKSSDNNSMFSWLFKTSSPKNKALSKKEQYSLSKQNTTSTSQNPSSQDLLNQVTELKLLLNEAKTTLATIQQEQHIAKNSIKNNNNKLPKTKPLLNSKPISSKQVINTTAPIPTSKVMTLAKKPFPSTIAVPKSSHEINKYSHKNKNRTSKKLKKIIKKKIVNSNKKSINTTKNGAKTLKVNIKNTQHLN